MDYKLNDKPNNKPNENNLKIKFVHVPKTAGTAIFNMTQKWKNFKRLHPNQNHVPVWKYSPKADEVGLTVIRHPYDRFLSAFYHMVDACNDDFYYRNAKVSDCNTMQNMGIDFGVFNKDPNVFLLALNEKTHPYHRTAQIIFNNFSIFKPQFYWLSDYWGKNIHESLKFILHQENLEKEFENVAKLLGEEAVWPRGKDANVRISRDQIQLNDLSKTILRNIYANDFKHFSFQF